MFAERCPPDVTPSFPPPPPFLPAGDPEKRMRGAFAYIGLLTLLGLTIQKAAATF